MRALGIDHVVLVCRDVERTLEWWRRELGLEPLRVDEWRAGRAPFPSLRVSGTTIIDFVPGERDGGEHPNVAHIAIEVDVEAATLESLVVERGWDVAFPLDRALYGARGTGAGVYIRDPDGTVVELRTYAG